METMLETVTISVAPGLAHQALLQGSAADVRALVETH